MPRGVLLKPAGSSTDTFCEGNGSGEAGHAAREAGVACRHHPSIAPHTPTPPTSQDLEAFLEKKAQWVRRQTIRVHGIAPETRIASSLSDIELFVALYYGKVLRFDPKNPRWNNRDRFILSKGHGGVSLYPIFADLGFFDPQLLDEVGRPSSFLGGIPDVQVPGIETTNGSLGLGLGVGCGVALALRQRQSDARVFVLVGDGELNEGSVWEAVMFAAHQRLANLTLIVDANQKSMLGHCERILNLSPLEDRFRAFGWHVRSVDGHRVGEVHAALSDLKHDSIALPRVLVAHTVKGKGVPSLEQDELCHIRTMSPQQVAAAIEEPQ
jgi:transketolase